MKAFITKYSLTRGIIQVDGKVPDNDFRLFKTDSLSKLGKYYRKPDWHLIREQAVKRACEMRDKRIKSLERQIDKLQKMEFE